MRTGKIKMATCISSSTRKRIRQEESNDDIDCQNNDAVPNSSSCCEGSASLPRDICSWREEDICRLAVISYDEEITPIDLLAGLGFPSTPEFSDCVSALEEFYKTFCSFHDKLDHDFHAISRHDAYYLRNRSYYSSHEDAFFSSLNCQHRWKHDKKLRHWIRRFETCGITFAEKLYYMTVKRDLRITLGGKCEEKQELCDLDFQFLFEAFLSMFGLQSYNWAAPFITRSTLQCGGDEVSGKADILYCRDISLVKDITERAKVDTLIQILAVCEVYRASANRTSNRCHGNLSPDVPSNVLSKHFGQLLLYYQNSCKTDGIIGMIVQDTKVTFTALQMSDEQYKAIKTKTNASARPKLTITKQYDFMKKQDRDILIRPLLELAMMQRNPTFMS